MSAHARLNFQRKQEVLIRRRQSNGRPHTFVRGRIETVTSRGPEVFIYENETGSQGTKTFVFWSDVQALPAEEKPIRPPTFATIGDKLAPALRTVVSEPKPEPEPPAKSERLLISTQELDAMKRINPAERQDATVLHLPVQLPTPTPTPIDRRSSQQKHRPPAELPSSAPPPPEFDPYRRRKLQHKSTQIGLLIRREREKMGLKQVDLAKLLQVGKHGVTANYSARVSAFELGKAIPNDDELTALVETFNMEDRLDDLIRMRDSDLRAPRARPTVLRDNKPPPAQAEDLNDGEEEDEDLEDEELDEEDDAAASSEPESATMRIEAHVQPPNPTPPTPPVTDPASSYNEFIESLDTVAPMPVDKEKRRLWLAMAAKLYEVTR